MKGLYFLSVCLLTLLASCDFQQGRLGHDLSGIICNDIDCINSVCPQYNVSSGPGNSLCASLGNCELRKMPITSQLFIPVKGEIACGPTSAHMALDSLIETSAYSTTGWLSEYSKLLGTQANSISVEGCTESDLDCKKVLTAAKKLIGKTWNQDNARPVKATEVRDLVLDLEGEITSGGQAYDSGTFPDNIDQCYFVTGSAAISESTPWNNVLLYLSHEQTITSSSTHNGTPVNNIKFGSSAGVGHFITMNGYTVTRKGVLYKFHCPIYGVKNYFMRTAKLNEPFCVSEGPTGCMQYVKVTEMPPGFSNSSSFSYIVEVDGEQNAQAYKYRVIASVSGIM